MVHFFFISIYGSSHRRCSVKKDSFKKPVFSCEICEDFKNTYFEEHLRTTAYGFIRDTTLFHETILKKHTNGKTTFQDGKEYNQKQDFE